MNRSNGTAKIVGLCIFSLVIFASPVLFFDFHSSLKKPEQAQNLMQDQTYLRAEKDLDTEERDEDPRIFYLPDHNEGFASWLKDEIELPGLELPNLEIPEPEFYLEEDFPDPLNSLRVDLETKIRKDWPLPEMEEEKLDLELKKSDQQLLVFRGDEARSLLLSDDELSKLFSPIERGLLIGPSILKVKIADDEMDIDLVKSCGVRTLDNAYAVALLREFYQDRVLEEVTKNPGNRDGARSDFYLIEWRLAYKRLKSE